MTQNQPFDLLVAAFRSLPGVGLKTAQRYAYSIISGSMQRAKDFSAAVIDAKEKIITCKTCGNFTDREICVLCEKRPHTVICVVKDPKDVLAIEKIKHFGGVYHVLHGTLSPLDNRGPDDIRIRELVARIAAGGVEEVIMATNPDVEGDVTALYIAKILKPIGVKITRLAQGISIGSELEFADEITLEKALERRSEI